MNLEQAKIWKYKNTKMQTYKKKSDHLIYTKTTIQQQFIADICHDPREHVRVNFFWPV